MKRKATALLLVLMLAITLSIPSAAAGGGNPANDPKITEARMTDPEKDRSELTRNGIPLEKTSADDSVVLQFTGDRAELAFSREGNPFVVAFTVTSRIHDFAGANVAYDLTIQTVNHQPVNGQDLLVKNFSANYNKGIGLIMWQQLYSSNYFYFQIGTDEYRLQLNMIFDEIDWIDRAWDEGPKITEAFMTGRENHHLYSTVNGEYSEQDDNDELFSLHIGESTATASFSIGGKPFVAELDIIDYRHYEEDNTVGYYFQFCTINDRPVTVNSTGNTGIFHLFACYDGILGSYDPFFYSGTSVIYVDDDGVYNFFFESIFDEIVWDAGEPYEIGTMFTGTGVSNTGQYDLAFAGYLDLTLPAGENELPLADIHRQTISILAHNNNNGVNRIMQSSTIEEMTVYVSGGKAKWVRILGRVQTTGGTLDRYTVTLSL